MNMMNPLDPSFPRHGVTRRQMLATASAALAAATGVVQAQTSGPITIIVPSSPGSAPDIIARLVGQRMATVMNNSVVVDNRPGANGIVGASVVSKAAGDGRTLMLYDRLTLSVNPLLFQKLAYEPDALTGITDVASVDLVFVARADAPYKTWAEMVNFARANPGKVAVGTAGIGSVHHLSLEQIKRQYGVQITDVPYKGIAPAVAALLGGELGGVITGPETVLEHIQAGKLKALAFGAAKRSRLLPDVPTMTELGAPSDLLLPTYFSMFAPTKTAPAIIGNLQAVLATVLKDPSLIDALGARGLIVQASSPAVVQEGIVADRAKLAKVIRDANISIN